MGKEIKKTKRKTTAFTIAVIGSGNMGSAIIRGIIRSQLLLPKHITAVDTNEQALQSLQKELGIIATTDLKKAVQGADVLLLSVKPQVIPQVLQTIRTYIKPTQLILSIAAGVKIQSIQNKLNASVPIVRAMPNIAATVQMSSTALAFSDEVTVLQQQRAIGIFESIGTVVTVQE